jgi:UDP-N-acetylmuramoyl-L-alanyl-D-glutamate--2,6-diaminopimelate ligase
MIDGIKKIEWIQYVYKRVNWIRSVYYLIVAYSAAVRYQFPSRHIKVIGITGTKGKTSSVEILSYLLRESGMKVASISSAHITINESTRKNRTGNSMPARFFLQKFLRDAVDAGCSHAVVEVTSQGVAMHRHRGIVWDCGALTNLHPEHIDWHGSYEKYRAAKVLFLEKVARDRGVIFLNKNDKESLGIKMELEKRYQDVVRYFDRKTVQYIGEKNQYFAGDFSRDNAALALAIADRYEVAVDIIQEALKKFGGVVGRFEKIQEYPFTVIVDYAHTPDSLEALYKTIRVGSKKMICVLGSAGGGRDIWKRSKMGAIAGKFCDQIIITNEDPYDESPSGIIEQVYEGIPREKKDRTIKMLDRKEAIRKALESAKQGDVVVLTGKGSEDAIHVENGKTISWNERKVVEEILQKK